MAAQTNLFIDIATIWLHAARAAMVRRAHRENSYAGGPDGGDGGRGGDIIFVADDHLSTLMDFRYKRKYAAPEGAARAAQARATAKMPRIWSSRCRWAPINDAESGLVIADLSDHPSHHGSGRPRRLRQRTTFCHPHPPDPQVCKARYARRGHSGDL